MISRVPVSLMHLVSSFKTSSSLMSLSKISFETCNFQDPFFQSIYMLILNV